MSVVIDVQALKTYLQSREAAAASLPVTQRKGTATKQVALALKASSSK
jgi:hypothetical protein